MTVGSGVPKMGWQSAIGVAKETTFGTFVTSTAFIEFSSESLKMEREEILIEAINTSRDITKRLVGNETVGGTIEAPLNVASDALVLIMKQAMGGTLSSAAVSGGSSYLHTLYTGDMEDNKDSATAADFKSLSIAVRRGDADAFNYYGCRVSQLTISGEVGSPINISAEIVGKGMSISATIPAVSLSDVLPVNFTGITIQTGDSITNVSAECFTSFEFVLNNNIDTDQRCLGSRQVAQLPPLKRNVTLTLNQRFDTTTAFNRFFSNTITAIKVTCDAEQTITTGATTYSMIINLPKCYLNSTQPEVGGADVLTQELMFTALYSSNTNSTYSVQMLVCNATSGY